jgi:hypothetical protein
MPDPQQEDDGRSATAIERTRRDPIRVSARRWLSSGALAAFLLLAGATIGYLSSKSGTVTLHSELVGTVSVVNSTGAKFCLAPSGGGEDRCGLAYQRLDAAPLQMGQEVRITVASIKQPGGTAVEVFVIQP